MITPWQIYWITRLDTLNMAGVAMMALGFLVGLFLFGPICDPDIGEEAIAKLKRAQKWLLTIGIVGVLICTFVPTKRESAAIIVVPKIANSETIAELGDGIKTLAIEWMEELRPKKEENKWKEENK